VIWLLAVTVAMADQPASTFVDVGQTVTATTPSWLVPEPYFDRCLANARALPRVTEALDECERAALAGLNPCQQRLEQSASALTMAHDRMVSDAMQLGDCTARVAVLEAGNVDLRRQRNRATAISVGAVAVAAVVVGAELAGGAR